MLGRAKNLGDPGTTTGGTFTPDWLPEFKKDIHGVILFSGESHETVSEQFKKVMIIFKVEMPQAIHVNPSITEIIKIVGDVRPGKESGHEQFVSLSRKIARLIS